VEARICSSPAKTRAVFAHAQSIFPPVVTMPDKDACTEMAKEPPNISHSLVNANVDCATADLNQIIDCCRYNSFGKLVRITAYVLRFVRNLRFSVEKKNEKRANDLTSSELDEADNCMIRISKQSPLVKKSSS
jgi:hypothetical protein